MTSNDLVDLLYVAYNRDEAEIFGIDKAISSGYEELYTTAADVLDKKMEVLDQEIEKQALELINEKVIQVRTRKQQEIERKQARFGELIRERAEAILKQNAAYLGRDTSNQAIEMIKEEAQGENAEAGSVSSQENDIKPKRRGRPKKINSEEYKGGDTNVGEEARPKKRGRRPKYSAE